MKYLLFIILLSGLAIRLYKIDLPLLEFYPSRQVQTADITANFVEHEFNLLKPTVSYLGPGYQPFLLEFPGYNFVVATIYKLTNSTSEIYGRIFSVSGWLIASIFLFLLARDLLSKYTALTAVFFYTFSPLSILISRSFQPDQWVITFSVLSIFYFLRWSKREKLSYLLLGAIFASISMLLKTPSFIFTFLPALYLVFNSRAREKILALTVLAISLVPSALWYGYSYSQNLKGLAMEGSFALSNWFGFDVFLNPKYYINIFGFENNLVLLPIGMILFVFGLTIKLKRDQKFLYIWLISVILYFLLFNKHNMTHEYYHLPFLPIASLFIGIAAVKIYKGINNTIISRNIIFAFLAILVFVTLFVTVPGKAYKVIDRFKNVPAVSNHVKSLTTPDDLIIGAMDAGPTLVYYSNRNGWSFEINREDVPELYSFYGVEEPRIYTPAEELEDLRAKGAKIFAVGNLKQLEQNPDFFSYMFNNYQTLSKTNEYVIFDLEAKVDVR